MHCWHWIQACTVIQGLGNLADAASVATRASARTTAYHDAATGFTFAEYATQYQLGRPLIFRVAVPTDVQGVEAYDSVLQVVAPVDVGWIGFAWGGRMIGDPLTVAWANGNSMVVSSRRASDHTNIPSVYSGVTYTVLPAGTHVNRTHWQYTVRCQGCTYYMNSGGSRSWIYPTGQNHLAFAYSATRPSSPASTASRLTIHDVTNNWDHDFSVGQNPTFNSLVAQNIG